jgi:gamma-butyrobetaine dioxygenase
MSAFVDAPILAGDTLIVRLADGRLGELHKYALRDACPCGDCRHPVSGQRLFESTAVVPEAKIVAARLADRGLEVDWEDGHTSLFSSGWIEAEAKAASLSVRPQRDVSLWGSDLQDRIPAWPHAAVTSDTGELRAFLTAVAELGFAVLRDAPREEGEVARVAELFSFVRETNYGRVFDVSVRVDATNLADTAMALSLHTDNAYRVPTPTVQLLQCLVSDVAGGETALVDGFRAVVALSAAHPEQLATLARTPIRFAYRDAEAELEADVPVIELEPNGSPRALHVNNRSKGIPAGTPWRVASWYDAYFDLLRLIEAPDAQIAFRLEAGDVVVFDNLRILHGRTGFSGEGARRLQGCYADRDGLLSTLAVLERDG